MATAIDLNGIRSQGHDVRMANITAVQALANIVKTSLGPQGLDKMLVDEIGDITITNDGATILRQIEVEHPAARILVELSQLQDKEVGDGTTSVVIVAAELLKRALEMIRNKIHPSHIISGYKTAAKFAVKYIEDNLSVTTASLGAEGLRNVAKTSMSSKLIGGEDAFFSELAVKAITHVQTPSLKYPVKNVNIVKAHGLSSLESEFFPGFVLRMSRVSQQMPLRIEGARIACLDFNLNKFRLGMGIQVLVNDPKNLEQIRKREMDILKERLEKVLAQGVNVIFTTKAMDDVAAKYLVEKGVMGLRRVEKSDLRKIAKSTGASIITTMATNDGSEVFEEASVGKAECVYEENLGDNDFVFIKNPKGGSSPVCTLVLRGANEFLLDEVDRSLHDSLCVLKRTLESGKVVSGGGSVETALSVYLEKIAQKNSSNDQIAIAEFAESLLVIPKQLSLNAAKDATELVSKMIVLHNNYQNDPTNEKLSWLKYIGLDLLEGKVRNNMEAGVLEPMVSKVKSIKFATEAAIAILRIDEMIKLAAEKEDQPQRHC
jgi:T-complex protein 1 subunit alpha